MSESRFPGNFTKIAPTPRQSFTIFTMHNEAKTNLKKLLTLTATLALSLFCIGAGTGQSAPYLFTQIDVRRGLSENCVKAIIQDRRGFIWLGTKNGLCRYDGRGIKCYDVDDEELGVGNHNVSALFEDKEGNIWVGTDKGMFVFNPMDEKFSFFGVKTTGGHAVTDWISQIADDGKGNIWIISPTEGAFRYNIEGKTLTRYKTAYEQPTYKNNPQCMCVRNGRVWIGTNGAGLFLYDGERDELTQYVRDNSGYSIAGKNVFAMCNHGGKIIFGEHEDKLLSFDLVTKRFEELNSGAHYKVIRALLSDGKNIYVGTNEGLYVIHSDGTETHVTENHDFPYSLSDNVIFSICRDADGGLWLGTNFGGVNYMPREGVFFRDFTPPSRSNSPSGRKIREMTADNKGRVWIASEDGTLDIYDPATGVFETADVPKYGGGTARLALMTDGDKVWSGVFKNGLDIIDAGTMKISHFTPENMGLEEGSVYALFKDSRGRIWLGNGNGLFIKTSGMRFARVETLPLFFAQDIGEDRDGNIWIATMGNGAFCYNPQTGRYVNYTEDSPRGNSVSSNSISSMTFDRRGNIWFSTDRGGICKYDISAQRFTRYSKEDGLPDDIAYKVLEDDMGHMWFGTNHGMVRLDEKTGETVVYDNNGTAGNQYNYKSAIKTSEGDFIFGKTDGLVRFNPTLAGKRRRKDEKVYITNVSVDGREVQPGKGGILRTNIIFAGEIHLPHDFSNLSLSVSDLDFSGIKNGGCEYMLEGVDKSWIKISSREGSITYSKLQPGKYIFRLRVEGNPTTLRQLRIIVAHPWYTSLWAVAAYVLLAVLAGYCVWHTWQKTQMRRLSYREKQYRDAADREILNSKIHFFTNITHEIRTPLTLITGSLENVMNEKTYSEKMKKNLAAIGNNCNRLLDLANQLLDFRKLNSNSMTLYFTETDIMAVLRETIRRFEPEIARGHKVISLETEEEKIVVPSDREAVTKIVSNLLNNARKYSETFISVVAGKDGERAWIAVTNDGEKIPAARAGEIFTPFVQLDETNSRGGSGIGLPLARSLAELHNGTLELDTASEYNRFVLSLPIHQENVIHINRGKAVTEDTVTEARVEKEVSRTGAAGASDRGGKKYTVLIVEDNVELLEMIDERLGENYNTVTAANGAEAIRKLRTSHVDIIISDVIMPVMNGLDMTREIKGNMEFNHIPVILLTARNTIENRIEGLRAGADAYVDKPFRFPYLLAEIETVLENRRRERESFLHKPYIPVQSGNVNKQNEKFLKKMSDIIVANMTSPDFNVERLGVEMCMSRSSLHRKIKEVSDLTPIDFIKIIRLKKAAELIQEYDYRTNEVCEMVGINSPSYFIKLFQKQFGMTPKEFSQNCHRNRNV